MKKIILLTLLALLSAYSVNAQNNNRSLAADSDGDFSLFLSLGSRPFHLEESTLDFSYVDESPSQDYIYTSREYRQTNHSFGAKLGLQIMGAKGFNFRVVGDAYLGQISGTTLDIGFGYTIGRRNFHVRPMIVCSYGTHFFSLGTMDQNDTYIDIKGTRFYERDVPVKLNTNHILVSPQLEIGYEITPKYEIIASGGYNMGRKGKSFFRFDGYDENNESINTKTPITDPNATLKFNGQTFTNSPVGLSGFFIHVGMGFRFAS